MRKTLYKVKIMNKEYSCSIDKADNIYEYEILLFNLLEDLVCNFNQLGEHDINHVSVELKEYLEDEFSGTNGQKEMIMKIFEIIKPNLLKEKEEAIEVVDNVDRER